MIKISKINLKEAFDTFPYGMEDKIPGDLWNLEEFKSKKDLENKKTKEKTNGKR